MMVKLLTEQMNTLRLMGLCRTTAGRGGKKKCFTSVLKHSSDLLAITCDRQTKQTIHYS